jgi:hypothetical protein
MAINDVLPSRPAVERDPDWYRSATRWTQLTFTDDDPARFDLDFWVDVMRRTRSTALCLSAGGYMAFYPTRIPFHHRSVHLGDRDPFGELVEAARGLGMHVMARVDPHAVHRGAAEAHPEWLAYDIEGRPLEHESMPGLWWTDPTSSYHTEFTTEIALEIVREYDVDAVFANRWEGPPRVLYGETTARRFRVEAGEELPRESDPLDPAWPAYTAWRSRKLSELVVRWDDAVRSVKPHVRFIPNRGAALTRDLVPELVEDRYPMFFVDKQGRSGDEATWMPGRIGKRARGLFPDRPVALITSVGPEDHELRWKDSVADPHETRGLIVDGFAHGALPWFTKFKAECFDERWVAPMVEAFGLHERFESAVGHLRPTAEVVLLDSHRPRSHSPMASYLHRTTHEDGVYQALVEARVPFEYIAEEALSDERLDGVRVVVLPGNGALGAATVAALERFVERGGGVVSLFDSGITDAEDGRRVLALGELLGVRLDEDVRGPLKNKYMTLEGDHPLTRGYEGARRILAGAHVLGVTATEDAEVPFRFVPDYPDLPMEEVYPRPGAATPAVVTRTHASGGRTVHIAFDLGEVFWRALQPDHARLLAGAVSWALGEQPPAVAVEGPGLVDVAVRDGADELAVTLVNLTDPKAMRGPRSATLPLAAQEVVVRIPEGSPGVRVHCVISGAEPEVRAADGMLRIAVPPIHDLEVVHIRWSPTGDRTTGGEA